MCKLLRRCDMSRWFLIRSRASDEKSFATLSRRSFFGTNPPNDNLMFLLIFLFKTNIMSSHKRSDGIRQERRNDANKRIKSFVISLQTAKAQTEDCTQAKGEKITLCDGKAKKTSDVGRQMRGDKCFLFPPLNILKVIKTKIKVVLKDAKTSENPSLSLVPLRSGISPRLGHFTWQFPWH